MRQYRVLLPVEIDGQIHGFGAVIELDLATAKAYSHALVAVDATAAADGKRPSAPHVVEAVRRPQ